MIIADNVQLLGGKADNGGSYNQQPSGGFASQFQPRNDMSSMSSASNSMNDIPYAQDNSFPEDIPF